MIRFAFTIFLGAFLLFQVQPLMGRYVLPWFGGGPAVWTNCMLFFQALLVGGYAYAHWLGGRNTRVQAWVHSAVLAVSLLFLPVAPRADLWKPLSSDNPSLRILMLLAATVGAPYLVLSATGPLVQRWFTLALPGRSPWRLYALSNLGSLVALVSYPFVFEPWLRLRTQSWLWSGLYVLFAALCGWTAWQAPATATAAQAPSETRLSLRRVLFWMALSAASSTLLLATTNQISQEIAVTPFLWVAPLSIYLVTFILTFENPRWYHRTVFAVAAGIMAPAACAVISATVALSLWSQIGVFLAALFVTCMLCHGELALSRPEPAQLTAFYLAIAIGGALGGVFAALIAPRIFRQFTEFPIGLAAACLLGFGGWLMTGALKLWTSRNFAIRIPLMALLLGGLSSAAAAIVNQPEALESWRNFYGILRVNLNADDVGPFRQLTHGRIRHGFQYIADAQKRWPTSYYGPHSGVGIALQALGGRPRRVAVIGLGTGTLASWGASQDSFRFYEINPDVELVARKWFTYLKDTPAKTSVTLGDARVELERELAAGHAGDFDLIAVDAFSSDAIPMHLLTAECGDVYRKRLAPGGLLLLHISNRSLTLEPVTQGLAQYLGWRAVEFNAAKDPETGETSSSWVLLTPDPQFLKRPDIAAKITTWEGGNPAPILWTDDFASLWHVVKWK